MAFQKYKWHVPHVILPKNANGMPKNVNGMLDKIYFFTWPPVEKPYINSASPKFSHIYVCSSPHVHSLGS